MKRLKLSDIRQFSVKRACRRIADAFTEGWYIHGDPASADRMRLVKCNYTSNVIANLIGGTFWTGLLLYMNADDGFIGTISMLSTSANMLQCLSPLLLERFPKRRKLLTIMRSALYIINVVLIGLIPMICPDTARQTRLLMTGIGVLLVNLINAFISPGLSIWHMQSLPNNVRRSYFSIITMTVGAVVAVCNLLGSRLVDIFANNGMQYYGLLALRGVALVLCVYEIIMYSRIKEYPYEGSGAGFRAKDLVTLPFKEKKYLLTIAVTFLWNVTANIPGSYYTVYLLKDIEVSYTYITLISMINVPVVLLLTPLWRRALSRFGWFKTLYISMAAYIPHYVALALVTKGTLWMYPLSQIMGYMCAVGINLSFTGIPYVNMPARNQTVFIGFYSTVGNFAALMGVTIGRSFVLSMRNVKLNILGFMLGDKQLIVLLTGLLMCIAIVGIRLIYKRVGQDQ